jgi:DNA polymerase delta subunit 1
LRTLSYDIECCGRKGHFPDPEQDPVIQIASYISTHGSVEPPLKVVHVLGTCAPISGATVMTFSDEREMLRSWRTLLTTADPDWIIGYNILDFDNVYLIERASTLGLEDFPYWGRVLRTRAVLKTTTFSSKAYGTRETKRIEVPGRVQFDLLAAIRRDYKLGSYSLNSVSAKFLDEQKEDVHHSEIAGGGLRPPDPPRPQSSSAFGGPVLEPLTFPSHLPAPCVTAHSHAQASTMGTKRRATGWRCTASRMRSCPSAYWTVS